MKLNQKGQTLLIVLLATLVALTIGISLAQRSISDLSNSTKLDDSSRALAAAEAGLERGLISPSNFTIDPSVFGNQSSADVKSSGLIPSSSYSSAALSFPSIDRSTFAQFWFADPSSSGQPAEFYKSSENKFTLYFGDPKLAGCNNDTCPAIALTLVVLEGSSYKFHTPPVILDSKNRGNQTTYIAGNCTGSQTPANLTYTIEAPNPAVPISGKQFLCKYDVTYSPSMKPILLRARLLFSNTAQPIAIEPKGSSLNPWNPNLPPQATILSSTGTSGQSQRNIRLFNPLNVEPVFFDYAIFSSGDILK